MPYGITQGYQPPVVTFSAFTPAQTSILELATQRRDAKVSQPRDVIMCRLSSSAKRVYYDKIAEARITRFSLKSGSMSRELDGKCDNKI